jgi:hypothetical protein
MLSKKPYYILFLTKNQNVKISSCLDLAVEPEDEAAPGYNLCMAIIEDRTCSKHRPVKPVILAN